MSTPDKLHLYQAGGAFALCVWRARCCTVYVLPARGDTLAMWTKRGVATEEDREAFVQACLVAAAV